MTMQHPAIAACLAAILLTGCATPITVTSNPPGASVYSKGSGRPAYRWRFQGKTPVTFKMRYNAINTFVQWPTPDNTRSKVRRDSLLLKDDLLLHFVREPFSAGQPQPE